jgi:CO/xanthine dehydrogenase Mo-binding subunit
MPTGQVVDSAAPVAEILRLVRARPLPPDPAVTARSAGATGPDLRTLPGGVSNTTHGEGVVRGIGYAVGIKNVGFSEGFDDYSTARVRLELIGGEPTAQVHTAAAEVGQGLVTVMAQIARTELGVERVVILPADTSIGSAGSSSASRQTYVTGGAVRAACRAVKEELLRRARERHPGSAPELADWRGEMAGLLGEPAEETVTCRSPAGAAESGSPTRRGRRTCHICVVDPGLAVDPVHRSPPNQPQDPNQPQT